MGLRGGLALCRGGGGCRHTGSRNFYRALISQLRNFTLKYIHIRCYCSERWCFLHTDGEGIERKVLASSFSQDKYVFL